MCDEGGSVAVSSVPDVTDVSVSRPSLKSVRCRSDGLLSEMEFVETQCFPSVKKRAIACGEHQEGMSYEGTPANSPPMTNRRITTPMLRQGSFSSREEKESSLERPRKDSH